MIDSILVSTAEDLIINGTLQQQEEALDAIGMMSHTDEKTAETLHDLEQRLRQSIMRKQRPPKTMTA